MNDATLTLEDLFEAFEFAVMDCQDQENYPDAQADYDRTRAALIGAIRAPLLSRLEAYETAIQEWAATGAPYEHTGVEWPDQEPRCAHDLERWPCAAIRMVRLLPADVIESAAARVRELSES